MIKEMLIVSLLFAAGVSSVILAFAETRARLLRFSIALSAALGFALWLIMPTYLVLFYVAAMIFADLCVFTFSGAFALGIGPDRKLTKPRKIYLGILLWVICAMCAAATIRIFSDGEFLSPLNHERGALQANEFYQFLWHDGWLIVAILSLLVLSAAIGGFFLFGRDERGG